MCVEHLRKNFTVKEMAYLGLECKDKEAKILNKIITYTDREVNTSLPCITWEAASRHFILAARHFGLQAAGTRLTIGDKANFTKRHPLMGDELEQTKASLFRSGCMRVAFLAMDRPEIQYM